MIPDRTKTEFLRGGFNLETATVKVALIGGGVAYTPDSAAHEFVSDVLDGGTTAVEFSDAGYSRETLTNLTVTEDNIDSEGAWDADDVVFANLGSANNGEVVQGILVYEQIGGDDTTPADDPILRVIDDSETAELPITTNSGNFQIAWDAEGIINAS
jgi:hypothetical protein